MSSSQIVHLVRHGAVYNPTGVLYGRLPGFHLSRNGQQMAERLGEYFSGFPLARLVSSPLERAQETMAPIAAAHPGLELSLDERLIEAGNKLAGQVFGKHNKAVFNPANWPLFVNPLRPSWGEPYSEIAARMRAAITDVLVGLAPGQQAVLVSHQLPIWVARLSAEGRRLAHNPAARRCILASVTSFRFTAGAFTGITYAEPALDLLKEDGNRAFSSGS